MVKEMKNVYLVILDWSTDDGSDVDIEAFDSYAKAVTRFNERIKEEKTDISWVQNAFDENDNLIDGYDFDERQPDVCLETYAFWQIENKYNWYMHECISIVKLEVK